MTANLYSLIEALDRLKRTINDIAAGIIVEERLADVSLHHLTILEVIANLEQPTTSQLAEALGVTRPTVTALIKRLEGHGYIARIPSPTDGRSFTIALTEQGRALSTVHTRIHHAVAAHLLQTLDHEELSQLVALLARATREDAV